MCVLSIFILFKVDLERGFKFKLDSEKNYYAKNIAETELEDLKVKVDDKIVEVEVNDKVVDDNGQLGKNDHICKECGQVVRGKKTSMGGEGKRIYLNGREGREGVKNHDETGFKSFNKGSELRVDEIEFN